MSLNLQNPFDNSLPIVVDLDGTLIYDEVSYLTFCQFCREYPLKLLMLPFWLLRGIAYIKQRVAEIMPVDPSVLRYNPVVLDLIKQHNTHSFILATGADESLARAVAEHLGLFDQVLASDGVINNISDHKAARLNELFGSGNYIYLGNSSQDINVWKHAAYAVAVNAPSDVLGRLKQLGVPYQVLEEHP